MQRFRRSSREIVMPNPMSERDRGDAQPDSEKPQTGEPAFLPDALPQSHELQRDGEFWGIFADEGTIGKGSFAKVKKVRHRLSGERFAVKILDKTSELIDVSDLIREVTLLSSLHHPNIVKLFAVYEGRTRLFLLMELAEGGEFMHRLGEDNKTHSEDSVRRHVRTLVRAIGYMHENHFAHRDLKPENVLLSDNSPDAQIKIIDFGLSRPFDANEAKKMQTVCGTHAYLSPELVQMVHGKIKGYGKEVDMWGIGLMTFIMLFGFNPFARETQLRTHDAIDRLDWRFPKDVSVSPEAKEFIARLLTANVKMRLTAEQALECAWLTVDDLGEQSFVELISDGDVPVKKKLVIFNALEKIKRMVKSSHRRVSSPRVSPSPLTTPEPHGREQEAKLASIPAWGSRGGVAL